ncbi:hypothetical protein BS17DRAFT_768723 [Gyrodon lividus]|nr:hypothetical protein BS17DRAFT_768723 [Gyrodon lividus]
MYLVWPEDQCPSVLELQILAIFSVKFGLEAILMSTKDCSFDCDPSLNLPLGLNVMITHVLAKVQSLHSKMGQQEEVINELRSASDSLASELKANQEVTAKKKHVQILALNVEDNTPFEIVEGGRKIWHPDWLGKVDNNLNAQFIQELAQQVWNNEEACCLVADKYETESCNVGTVAMIDSEFGTNILSYTSGELNEDMLDQRKEADQKPTPESIKEEDKGITTKTTTEPQKKHHPLNSNKGTLPFATMVSKMWKAKYQYPEMKILEGGEWLEGFYGCLRDGEILHEDASYLKELAEWHERYN